MESLTRLSTRLKDDADDGNVCPASFGSFGILGFTFYGHHVCDGVYTPHSVKLLP